MSRLLCAHQVFDGCEGLCRRRFARRRSRSIFSDGRRRAILNKKNEFVRGVKMEETHGLALGGES
jgi:hypothetical protein